MPIVIAATEAAHERDMTGGDPQRSHRRQAWPHWYADRSLISVPHDRAARVPSPCAGVTACAMAWMPSYLENRKYRNEADHEPYRLRPALAALAQACLLRLWLLER